MVAFALICYTLPHGPDFVWYPSINAIHRKLFVRAPADERYWPELAAKPIVFVKPAVR